MRNSATPKSFFAHLNERPASASHSEMALSKAPQTKVAQKTVLPRLLFGSQPFAPITRQVVGQHPVPCSWQRRQISKTPLEAKKRSRAAIISARVNLLSGPLSGSGREFSRFRSVRAHRAQSINSRLSPGSPNLAKLTN